MTAPNELLRASDVEKLYGPGLGEHVLRRLRRNGTGPDWFAIGRRIVYVRSDIDSWLSAQRERRAS